MKTTKLKNVGIYFKLLAAVVMWGGSFIATKIAVLEISPVTVVWSRFAIGVVLLGMTALQQHQVSPPSAKELLHFALLGFLGISLHQWLQSTGLVTSQASTTAWIVATTPLFMALMGWFFLKERIGWKSIAGILLATIGVLLVVSKGKLVNVLGGSFGAPGDLLVLISAPNWAVYSVLSRDALKKHTALKMTFYVVLFGWLFTSMQFLAVNHWGEFNQISTQGWLSIAFLGIFCTYLAYIYWYDALQALPAAHVGAFLYIEPVVSTLIAAAILKEEIVLASVLGGGLTLFGVWLVDNKRQE
ncbi:MAG TPA: DMT family transporter [Anaerolineae bacterium]|nr:DMT family transporter [Anaerolineae bacterium]